MKRNSGIRMLCMLLTVAVACSLCSAAYAISKTTGRVLGSQKTLVGTVVVLVVLLIVNIVLWRKEARRLGNVNQQWQEAIEQKKVAEEASLRIEAQRRAEELYQAELRHLADYDELTGIYNKRAFVRLTRKMIDENPEVSFTILRCDIDRFKIYNDLYGTKAGDECLKRIARLIKHLVGQQATYCRLQADHFAVCCPTEKLDMEWVVSSAERWRKKDQSFNICFGAYVIDAPDMEVGLMCDRALLALRKVKGNYRSRYAFYDETMWQEIMLEQEIVGEMTTALETGQFEVYFQPQYNYSTGELIGAEALARWNHPEKGLISPGVFIPIFEKNGFISTLDEYVWTYCCQSMRRCLDSSERMRPIPISVNISRLDIYNQNLCGILIGLVEQYALPITFLKLEITESVYMDNPEQLIEVVKQLQNAGFIVEMDDFGSGYSSLNTLKDVPVDVLKLDLSFLKGENSGRGGNILSSMVRMAQWLNLSIMAEGVETKEQADYLNSIGCKYMQGYYFAKPMPTEEFEALLCSSRVGCTNQNQINACQIDINELWDPQSQLAFIFNDVLGAAGIFEYMDGHLEALRLNKNFFKRLGTTEEQYEAYRTNCFVRFRDEEKQQYIKMLELAIETGEEVEFDICSKPFHEGETPVWACTRVRLIAQSDRRFLFYIALENISQEKALARLRKEAMQNAAEDTVLC